MNDDPISETRLAEIAAVLDEDIDTSDIPEADEAWFRGARLVLPENTLPNFHTVTSDCNRVMVRRAVILVTAMPGPQPSARAAADPRTVRLAMELLEHTAGRRRRCRC